MAFGDFGGALDPGPYAAETLADNVLRIESNGAVSVLGDPSAVALRHPDNLEFGPDGFLYVSEDRLVPSSPTPAKPGFRSAATFPKPGAFSYASVRVLAGFGEGFGSAGSEGQQIRFGSGRGVPPFGPHRPRALTRYFMFQVRNDRR